VLGLELGDVGPDLGLIPMPFQVLRGVLPRVAEQRPVDEVDGRGGALDVQQDGSDPRQFALARTGM
jgi:hypothetical protein